MFLSEKPAYRGCISNPDTFMYCIKLARLASGRARRRRRRWISRRGTTRGFYFYDLPLRLSTLLRTLSRLSSRDSVRWHVGVYKARPRHAGHVKFTVLFLAIHRRAEREKHVFYTSYHITQFHVYISVECIPER